jgi:hypothetical protein
MEPFTSEAQVWNVKHRSFPHRPSTMTTVLMCSLVSSSLQPTSPEKQRKINVVTISKCHIGNKKLDKTQEHQKNVTFFFLILELFDFFNLLVLSPG